MKICKNPECNNPFPYSRRVDGKVQGLSNRSYCLTCSPFKGKKTIQVNVEGKTFICQSCSQSYVYHLHHGMTKKLCNSCILRVRRNAIKQKAIAYKGGKCIYCGYSKCIAALAFHHTDPSKKDFGIGGKVYKWEVLKAELDKCVLVCHNCHAEFHFEHEVR